jgi:hypothetical protein
MTEKQGTLQIQPSGRWAICRPGQAPVEINSGEVFRIEVPGKEGLHSTRMEYLRHDEGGGGDFFSVHGHYLADGLRAAFFDQHERHARPLRGLGP